MNTNLRPVNNLTLIHRDRGYRWTDDKPHSILYQVRLAINNSGLSSYDIQALVWNNGRFPVARRTIDNLMNGKTKSPQLRTVTLVMAALGYSHRWIKH